MVERVPKSTIECEKKRNYIKARNAYGQETMMPLEPTPYGCIKVGQGSADELMRIFETRIELMKKGICSETPFGFAACDLMEKVLMNVHVGCFSEDLKSTERVSGSAATPCKKGLLLAIFDYCVCAAAMAKDHDARFALECFTGAIADLEMHVLGWGMEFRVCTHGEARTIVMSIERGSRLLWSELLVNEEQKRFKGAPEPDVPLGAYAQKVVEFCNFSKGRIKFKCGEILEITRKSGKACEILRRLLATSDPDGYERLGRNWQSHFVRKDANNRINLDSDMTKLRYHVFAEPVAKGRRGTGRFRLKARADTKSINALRRKYQEQDRKMAERANAELRRD